MKLLIVGCGYVGLAIANRLRAIAGSTISGNIGADNIGADNIGTDNIDVYALTRTEQRAEELRGFGVEPLVGDWLEAHSLSALDEMAFEYVIVAVPHRPVDPHGVQTHVQGLRNLYEHLGRSVRHLIYLSTTGVYGDCENELIDELTPTSPTRIGPEIAVAAERWLDVQRDSGSLVATTLRLAGIYGPERVPLAAKLIAGEALAVPREGYLNLVHVTDIARMILQILPQKMELPVYLFSDGQPVLRETFYRELARQCGVLEPTFVEPDPNDHKSRRATSKRVNPARLVQETSFAYEFPNYQNGLADALKSRTIVSIVSSVERLSQSF